LQPPCKRSPGILPPQRYACDFQLVLQQASAIDACILHPRQSRLTASRELPPQNCIHVWISSSSARANVEGKTLQANAIDAYISSSQDKQQCKRCRRASKAR
jgi:hypothetical protein